MSITIEEINRQLIIPIESAYLIHLRRTGEENLEIIRLSYRWPTAERLINKIVAHHRKIR